MLTTKTAGITFDKNVTIKLTNRAHNTDPFSFMADNGD